MPSEIKGQLKTDGAKFAVVVSRYNEFITSKLLKGALASLSESGCGDGDVRVVHVPGAFEIALAAKKLAESGEFDAVVCLGCVIRGDTPHFEYVAGEAARGVGEVALSTGVVTTFGVITADTLEQAIARSVFEPGAELSSGSGNKGAEAAMCAVEMVNVVRQLPG